VDPPRTRSWHGDCLRGFRVGREGSPDRLARGGHNESEAPVGRGRRVGWSSAVTRRCEDMSIDPQVGLRIAPQRSTAMTANLAGLMAKDGVRVAVGPHGVDGTPPPLTTPPDPDATRF